MQFILGLTGCRPYKRGQCPTLRTFNYESLVPQARQGPTCPAMSFEVDTCSRQESAVNGKTCTQVTPDSLSEM